MSYLAKKSHKCNKIYIQRRSQFQDYRFEVKVKVKDSSQDTLISILPAWLDFGV